MFAVLFQKYTFVYLFKGEWKPRQIDNPANKGKWVHPEIDNPEYTADNEIYKYDSFGVIGLDLWQVAICIVSNTITILRDLILFNDTFYTTFPCILYFRWNLAQFLTTSSLPMTLSCQKRLVMRLGVPQRYVSSNIMSPS